MLNILEDFDAERKRQEIVQTAMLNILEDFGEEKTRFALVQTAIQRGSSTFPATRRASQRMPHLRGTDNRKAVADDVKE